MSETGASSPLFSWETEHDCPYMGVRSCCSTDFCEDCICLDPAEGLPPANGDAGSQS